MSRWILPLLVIIGFAASSASACSIPVFRYALEHWQPDPFMMAVFHQGELTDQQQALLQKLQERDKDGTPIANIMVKAIDVESETNPGLLRLWELQETETLPWIAVHAPARSGPPQRIIGGELTAELVERLLQSPARVEVARRLIAGDSVVWVFLESGDPAADDAAFTMLSDELARLETTLRLPEIEAADFGDLSVVPESLRLAFSALRISRDDPAESALIKMLLHAEEGPANADPAAGPMAFPLFGRGRVLYSLSGERLERQSVEDACRFLTGACQCTVKAENPGLDLLFAVDWENQIESALPVDESDPPLVGLGGFAQDDASVDSEVAASADVAPSDEAASSASTSNRRAAGSESASGAESAAQDKVSDPASTNLIVKTWWFEVSQSRSLLLLLGVSTIVAVVATLTLKTRTK